MDRDYDYSQDDNDYCCDKGCEACGAGDAAYDLMRDMGDD